MTARLEMQKTPSGQYIFNLRTGDGQIILTSESYRQRAGVLNGIRSVKKNAGRPGWFECRTTAENQAYFVLTAAKGRVIGCGELYSSRRAMESGIQAVITGGPIAEVVDLSPA